MNIFGVVKIVGGLVVGLGSSTIAANAVKIVTPATTNVAMKACMKVGGYCLAGAAAVAATTVFEDKITIVEKTIERIKTKIQNKKMETVEAEA